MKVGFAGIVALLFFGLWLVGCDQANAPLSNSTLENESILAAPAVAASWHQLSDAQRNELIISEAKKWLNQRGGQCKEWIQTKVVWNASGNVVWLLESWFGGIYAREVMIFGAFIALAFVFAFIWFEKLVRYLDKPYQFILQ